jgi:Fur family zinc uptake transcriptional regulator
MIGYGPGHVKALDQISMVQRDRRPAHPSAAFGHTTTACGGQPNNILCKPLTKIRDTLYHFDLASFRSLLPPGRSMPMATSIAEHHAVRLAHADAHATLHGLALTPLRRQVYAAIVASERPVGAYELLDALAPQRGRMPPTTVYRALDFLLAHGFVHRIESKNAYVACCEIGVPHRSQFLMCDGCGATVEIPGDDLADQLSHSAPAHGFEVHRQVIELSGLCAMCARAARPAGASA